MKTETLQKLGASALLLVVALLSALWLAGTVSSPELHAKALAELDEKKITVMELTAATAVTSVAVSSCQPSGQPSSGEHSGCPADD